MSELSAQRELNRGFGDGMSRAVELAITPLVFGGLGWLLDSWLGTSPAFTVGLAVFAVVGMFLRLWYGYDLEMKRHESRLAERGGAGLRSPEELDADDDLWSRS